MNETLLMSVPWIFSLSPAEVLSPCTSVSGIWRLEGKETRRPNCFFCRPCASEKHTGLKGLHLSTAENWPFSQVEFDYWASLTPLLMLPNSVSLFIMIIDDRFKPLHLSIPAESSALIDAIFRNHNYIFHTMKLMASLVTNSYYFQTNKLSSCIYIAIP